MPLAAKSLVSVLRAFGPSRAQMVIHNMREYDPGLIGRAFPPGAPPPPGAVLLSHVDDAVGAQLDAIPSETTPGERRFLYHFFSEMWKGQGHVLEVGPFLGGTT